MLDMQCILDAQAKLAECPRWDEKTGTLYFVDIDAFQLCRFHPQNGTYEYRQFEEEIGCFSLDQEGGFIAAFRSGVYRFDNFHAPLTPYWKADYDQQSTRFNDGRCDFKGRFLAGTMYAPKDKLNAALYQFSNNSTTTLDQNAWTSNGLAFSPDGKTMYYSDTPNHIVYKFDYDMNTGKATNKTTFIEFPRGFGRPDGAAVDSEGNYWSALYAGQRVVKISPEGKILAEIAVPALYPTMLAFGGDQMKTLYITTCRSAHTQEELITYPHAGGIFAIETDVAGLIESRFHS